MKKCPTCTARMEQRGWLKDDGTVGAPLEWHCTNCGVILPRRKNVRMGRHGLTPTQVRVAERFVVAVKESQAHIGHTDVKRFELTHNEWFAVLVIEMGKPGDDGTMAAVFCRDRWTVTIGPRGAVKTLGCTPEHSGFIDCLISGATH